MICSAMRQAETKQFCTCFFLNFDSRACATCYQIAPVWPHNVQQQQSQTVTCTTVAIVIVATVLGSSGVRLYLRELE